jgi:cellulose synthase/poly-beta-1,6-N-acetylglucosamine synthase-like glycosyltransferase
VSGERHGKTYGMNLLVSRATASVVVFTDANVMLDIPSFANLSNYFSDPEIGCVCGHLKYINADDGVTAATGSLYWRIEEVIKQAESDTGSVMGADGSIFAIRRALHVPPPADIIDDMFVSFSILCNGHRVVRAPDVIAYEESVTAPKEEFARKIRISCQAFNVHRLLWRRLKDMDSLNLYKYVSHKLLRWFGMAFIVLGLFFFLVSLIMADMNGLAFFLSFMIVATLWAGTVYQIPVIPQVIDILMSYMATIMGLWRSVCGDRFQTWSPAQSIRQKDRS